MLWFGLALVTALAEAGRDVVQKKQLVDGDEYVIGFFTKLLGGSLLAVLALADGIPPVGPPFWKALVASGCLNVVCVVLYLRALRLSPLSLTVPMITFTPAFLLVVAPMLVGERPNAAGVIGVLLIVTGSYVLRLEDRRRGLVAPFRALLSERGARLMLLVAFLFAFTSSLDKIGVRGSSPLLWPAALNLFGAAALAPMALHRARKKRIPLGRTAVALLPVGLLTMIGGAAQMTAVKLTLVAYVIAVKRLSAAFGVLGGRLFFGETGLGNRLVGTLIMVAGVACIALLGQ